MVGAQGVVKLLEKMIAGRQNGSSCVLQASKQPPSAGGSLSQPPRRSQTPHASGFLTHALIFLFPWGNS